MGNAKNVIINLSYFLLENGERVSVDTKNEVMVKARELQEAGKKFRIVGVNLDGETVKTDTIVDVLPRGFFRTRIRVYRVDGIDEKMNQVTKVKLIEFIIDGYMHVLPDTIKKIPAAIECGRRVEMVFSDGDDIYISSHIVEFDSTSRELVTHTGHRYQF